MTTKDYTRFSQDIYRSVTICLQSDIKRNIVKALYNNGEMSFTSLLTSVGRTHKTSGSFAYHMRYMKSSKLLQFMESRKKYAITSLGIDFVEFLKRLEDRVMGASALDITGVLKKSPEEINQYMSFLKKVVSFMDVEFPELVKQEELEIV